MKKVLFWDFDGTLVHPNERFVVTFLKAAHSCGVSIDMDRIRTCFRASYPWNHPDVDYPERTGAMWWESFFEKIQVLYTENQIPEQTACRINRCFQEQMVNNNTYTIYEDTAQVLTQCKKMGYENYVLSNNYPELPLIIEKFGLSGLFSGYIVSANIGYEKPRAELFDYALRTAGFPSCGYMIGDNPVADILGGKAAGLKTILVHRHDSDQADYTCDTLTQILGLLEP